MVCAGLSIKYLVSIFRDCSSETCKSRRREMDAEMKNIRRELKLREDQLRQLERETQVQTCRQRTFHVSTVAARRFSAFSVNQWPSLPSASCPQSPFPSWQNWAVVVGKHVKET